MTSYLKYNWPSLSWAAFILVICLWPGHDLPKVEIINFDKLVHASVYFILSVLTYYGWQRQQSFALLHRHTFARVLVLLSLYGFGVEVMQETLTADRHYDLYDALANSTGAVLGAIGFRQWAASRQLL